jgi:hypothetical protein
MQAETSKEKPDDIKVIPTIKETENTEPIDAADSLIGIEERRRSV